MRKISTVSVIIMMLGLSGPALADRDDATCKPRAQGTFTTVAVEMDRLGYDVLSLKTDDGCLKARIVERESGGMVKAIFDPGTGELLRAKLAF